MLLLQFHIEDDQYAVDVRQIVEVLPLAKLKKLIHAPGYVAGLLNYRGQAVPVLDLCQIALGRPSKPRLNTRVLMGCLDVEGQSRLIGYIVERVSDTVKKEAADFLPSAVRVKDSPYLGDIAMHSDGIMQLIRLEALLPAEVRELLFSQ